MKPQQFDVYLINLDPTQGAEIQKTRPCLVISPNEMNSSLSTILIAPMTTTTRPYPTRIAVKFKEKKGDIALDQLRAIDQNRLIKKLGKIDEATAKQALSVLQEIFS